MTIPRNALAALLLFAFCCAYGLQATTIDLFPGQESEAFSPRTLPYGLAIVGMLLTLSELVKAFFRPEAGDAPWKGFDWSRALLFFLCMLAYGALFEPLGFLVATALFLGAGIAILGERRLVFLIVLPLVFSAGFWWLATQLLGLYLAPGFWNSGQ